MQESEAEVSEVKWIKIVTDIFDDEKMLLIEALPNADSIIVIWFKLLCLAGKTNNNGVFLMNNKLAYTEEMLAAIFRRDIQVVRVAIDTFVRLEMIEVYDGVITIPNWDKHQTLDSYEKKKARDRIYQAERRSKQKALIEKSSDNRLTSDDKSLSVVVSDIDIDKDKDIDKKEIDKPKGLSKKKKSSKGTNVERCLFILNEGEYDKVDYLRTNREAWEVIKLWLQYKDEKNNPYKETGLKTLMNITIREIEAHGLDAVRSVIEESISSNYIGIAWDRLNKLSKQKESAEDKYTRLMKGMGDV